MRTTPPARRALVALTAVGLAASTAVALAPSASAFYGSESTVKAAVLSTAKIATASGWDTTANPLIGGVARQALNDWSNDVAPATAVTDAQVAPEYAELVISASPAARAADFAAGAAGFKTSPGALVIASTTTSFTVEFQDADLTETITGRYAGSDGVALGACVATVAATTTTTQPQRAACATAIANAQASAWAAVSPNLVFVPASTVASKLLSAAAAHSAASLPYRAKTKVLSTKALTTALGGREEIRKYQTSANFSSLRISLPVQVAITQYGNRTNAAVALAKFKAVDRKSSTLYNVSANSYTITVKSSLGGKSTRAAATVVRYSDVLVVTSCVGNPLKRPTDTALRTCSRKLASAQVTKAGPLFAAIK